MRWLCLTYVLLATACNGDCVDGVCPDLDRAEKLPGPCESAFRDGDGDLEYHCTYHYDQDRLASAECPWHDNLHHEHGLASVTWTYDASGAPLRVDSFDEDYDDGFLSAAQSWRFGTNSVVFYTGDTPARSMQTADYDRATFAFLPMPGREAMWPQADLGLASRNGVTYEWTRNGTTLTRTSSDGAVVVFELDDRDRIIARGETRWVFDGDLLVERSEPSPDRGRYVGTYSYDPGGNLATWSSSIGAVEAYDYSCW